jgi:hypothetical protein
MIISKKMICIFIVLYIIFYFINNYLKNYENYEEDYYLPKKIYGYWDYFDDNNIIKAYIETWKRNISSEWEIIILTKKNVHNYVSKEFIDKFINLPSYRFSDFLRMYLLYNKGGVWIDASTIIINGNFLNKYYEEMILNKYDATLYEFKVHSIENYPYLENWFLIAPKNSKFIKDIYDEFVISYDMGFLNYKKNILENNIKLDNTLKYDLSTYHMQHAIIHYLLVYKKNKYKLNIKNADESMFKIQNLNNWDSIKIIDFIINNNDWNNFYAIKLVNSNRKGINDENIFINKLYTI